MTPSSTPPVDCEPTREDLLATCQRLLAEQPDPAETLGHVSDVCAVARALKQRLEAERWRPISEAPRDGTHILARIGKPDGDGRWYHLEGRRFVICIKAKRQAGSI